MTNESQVSQDQLDALLHATPEQLREALNLAEHPEPAPDLQQLLDGTDQEAVQMQQAEPPTQEQPQQPEMPTLGLPPLEPAQFGQMRVINRIGSGQPEMPTLGLPPLEPAQFNQMRYINRIGSGQPEISTEVALRNSLRAMESWLDLLPDGTAKHGMRAEIENMRGML